MARDDWVHGSYYFTRSKFAIRSGPSFVFLYGIATHRRAFYQTFFLMGILLNSVVRRGILSNNRIYYLGYKASPFITHTLSLVPGRHY